MRPSCLSQRSFGRSKGVDNHVRSAQGATSKPTAETRRSAALAPTLACIEEGAPLSIDDLAPQTPHPAPAWHAHPHAAYESIDVLADAGLLLTRVLDAVAGALAGRRPAVPQHVEALLLRLFPAATSISAALPTPDGQAITCTTLLHPGASAAAADGADDGTAPRWQHSEPLGAGVCSWRLAAPPSGASLRLMRALAHQLEARLHVQQGAAALACHLGTLKLGPAAAGADASDAVAAAAAAAGLRAAQAEPALAFAAAPADSFWGSY